MMPWGESWIAFAVALVPMIVLAVVWHETGHAVAGMLAGCRILAWGVGIRKPWFRVRLGESCFYFGRPLTSGLTLFRRKLVERRPAAEFMLVLGGPLFSVLGLAGGLLLLWYLGTTASWLSAWLFISALIVVASSVPSTWRSGTMRLDNDARLLLDILRFRSAERTQPVGPVLTTCRAIAELLDEVGNAAGSRCHWLHAALLEANLGNLDAAHEILRRVAADDAAEDDSVKALRAFVRAAVAVEANSDDAPDLIRAAAPLCGPDATASFLLDCLDQQWLAARGQDVVAQIHELRRRALAARRGDWLCWSEQLQFEAAPSEDDDVRCRELLARHQRYTADTERAKLLALATERLAARGEYDRARALFAEAELAISSAAAGIADAATRKAFLIRVSAPLRRGQAATADDSVPLFLAATPVEPPETRKTFTLATLCLGTAMFLATVAAIIADASGDPLDAEIADRIVGGLVTAWIVSLLTVMFAVVRRERPYARLFLGWLLGTLALLLSIAGGLHHLERHKGPVERDNPTRAPALRSADSPSRPSTAPQRRGWAYLPRRSGRLY